MSKYSKICNQVARGKIYINKSVSDFINRINHRLNLYQDMTFDRSEYFMEDLDTILHNNFDYDLIDDTFLDIIDFNPRKDLYFVNLVKTVFMEQDINNFGIYMESLTDFIYRDLFNPKNINLIKKLKYQKLIDLYDNYRVYRNYLSREFGYSTDHDFPALMYGYYYANNLDLNEVNRVIGFYLSNRDYYLEKLAMNGMFFPYNDDDTIPKFFLQRFLDLYQNLIPLVINDYKNETINKKRIK